MKMLAIKERNKNSYDKVDRERKKKNETIFPWDACLSCFVKGR